MKFLLALLLLFPLTGCVATYRDFPAAALDHPVTPGNCEVLNYQINHFNVLDSGGFNQLQDLFAEGQLCHKTVQAEKVPDKGLYVAVETEWRPMSLPALVFGYLSVSTLTILPAWSTQDGYVVNYHLYIDGEEKEIYRYKITRKAGVWLGLLPLVWVNAFTYKEADAFTATANQFARDARPYLDRKPPATTSP
jgi:hypothetical protein